MSLAYIYLPRDHTVANSNLGEGLVNKYTFAIYRDKEAPTDVDDVFFVYDSKCVDWDGFNASLKVCALHDAVFRLRDETYPQ